MVASIRPGQLAELLASGKKVTLFDVRTPAEFHEMHVMVAENTPLERLPIEEIRRRASGGEPIYVICRSGGRGSQACQKLEGAGISNVFNVEGGTLACEQAGLPMARGAKVMSLERQVRIAAGTLVVLGAALGLFVHPYWMGLSAFVGAGLVFAGVTDTCGMGMLLARMPWNQRGGSAAGGSCAITPRATS